MTVATAQVQVDLPQAAAVVVQAVHLQAEAVLVAHQCSNAHQSNNTNISNSNPKRRPPTAAFFLRLKGISVQWKNTGGTETKT